MQALDASVELPSLTCPGCKRKLSARVPRDSIRSAHTFDECLRKCLDCGVGFSNARTLGQETTIFRDPLDNVPTGLRDGFLDALSNSVNEVNRRSKLQKAAFSTSEDALTWCYFEDLRRTRRLAHPGWVPTTREPLLVLWGAQVGRDSSVISRIPGLLREISQSIGEKPAQRTEPDVVLDFGADGIAIIEVKHRATNDTTPSSRGNWDLYLSDCGAFKDARALKQSRCYELVRNWRFGFEMGKRLGVPVVVGNLGPPQLFQGAPGQLLDRLEAHLSQDLGRLFRRLSWPAIAQTTAPSAGIAAYMRDKYPEYFGRSQGADRHRRQLPPAQ